MMIQIRKKLSLCLTDDEPVLEGNISVPGTAGQPNGMGMQLQPTNSFIITFLRVMKKLKSFGTLFFRFFVGI